MSESLNDCTLLNLKGEASFKGENHNFPIWTSLLASLSVFIELFVPENCCTFGRFNLLDLCQLNLGWMYHLLLEWELNLSGENEETLNSLTSRVVRCAPLKTP
jgi:hypothetical protein